MFLKDQFYGGNESILFKNKNVEFLFLKSAKHLSLKVFLLLLRNLFFVGSIS